MQWNSRIKACTAPTTRIHEMCLAVSPESESIAPCSLGKIQPLVLVSSLPLSLTDLAAPTRLTGTCGPTPDKTALTTPVSRQLQDGSLTAPLRSRVIHLCRAVQGRPSGSHRDITTLEPLSPGCHASRLDRRIEEARHRVLIHAESPAIFTANKLRAALLPNIFLRLRSLHICPSTTSAASTTPTPPLSSSAATATATAIAPASPS